MAYYFGSFQIDAHSAGVGYFLLSKDLDFPTYEAQMSPLARYDGNKITGYSVKPRQIQVEIVVVGSSRSDCEARLDSLFAALSLRDQNLSLHSEDGRYWVANALTGKVKFAAGQGVVQAKVPVSFTCANPYAVAASPASPYDSGQLTYSGSASPWSSPVFSITGGGSVYSWPTMTLTHKTPAGGSTTLSSALTGGSSYTALPVVSSPAVNAGQALILTYTASGVTYTQKVQVSTTTGSGATSIPVNSFVAAASFGTSTTVAISVAWSVVQIVQSTDSYTLSASSQNDGSYNVSGSTPQIGTLLLPQSLNDTLVITCDPAASNGSTIVATVAGIAYNLEPVGPFPPLDYSATNFQVFIYADAQPQADFEVAWTPRWLN